MLCPSDLNSRWTWKLFTLLYLTERLGLAIVRVAPSDFDKGREAPLSKHLGVLIGTNGEPDCERTGEQGTRYKTNNSIHSDIRGKLLQEKAIVTLDK